MSPRAVDDRNVQDSSDYFPASSPRLSSTSPQKQRTTAKRTSLTIGADGRVSRLSSPQNASSPSSLNNAPVFWRDNQPVSVIIANGTVSVRGVNFTESGVELAGGDQATPLFEEPVVLVGMKLRKDKDGFADALMKRFALSGTQRKPRSKSAPPPPSRKASSFFRALSPSRSRQNLASDIMSVVGAENIPSQPISPKNPSSTTDMVLTPTPIPAHPNDIAPAADFQPSIRVKFKLMTANTAIRLVAQTQSDLDYLIRELESEKALTMAGTQGGDGTRLLYALRERDEANRSCRDCGEMWPEWVVLERVEGDGKATECNGSGAWTAGIVCDACSGRHRGRDSSRVIVRSFLLDDKLFADTSTNLYRAVARASNRDGIWSGGTSG
ncbi:hypothetical protein HK104_007307 [Borealophlyctis nickersoniae]|nr:hypothetical protein HK104_007307 [Borealophlyctis nickersoniae]